MSASAQERLALEYALRELAATDEPKVGVVAARHCPEGKKLNDFLVEIWAFLKTYNMGKPQISVTRVESGLAAMWGKAVPAPRSAAPAAAEPPPAPAEVPAKPKAPRRAAGQGDLAPNRVRIKVTVWEADDGACPWAAPGRYRPRRDALAAHRARLVGLANGDVAALEAGDRQWRPAFVRWFGTWKPAPAKVERFLAWCDALPEDRAKATPAKQVKTPAPKTEKRPAARGPLISAEHARPLVVSAALLSDGWEELVVQRGKLADYALRYSGADKISPTLSMPAAFVRLHSAWLPAGQRVRVLYRKETGEIRLKLGGSVGLVAQEEKGGLRWASRNLPALLGAGERRWVLGAATQQLWAMADGGESDLIFVPVAGATAGKTQPQPKEGKS